MSLGVASLNTIRSTSSTIFNRYGYTIDQSESYGNGRLRLWTRWRERPVFDDEESQGYTEAETRFFVITRSGTGLSGTRVSLRSETRYRSPSSGGNWQYSAVTPEMENYTDEIAQEFRNVFQVDGL